MSKNCRTVLVSNLQVANRCEECRAEQSRRETRRRYNNNNKEEYGNSS